MLNFYVLWHLHIACLAHACPITVAKIAKVFETTKLLVR